MRIHKEFPPNFFPPFCSLSNPTVSQTTRTRSLVLETKAYLHRRPAYNPEIFPHRPRWKKVLLIGIVWCSSSQIDTTCQCCKCVVCRFFAVSFACLIFADVFRCFDFVGARRNPAWRGDLYMINIHIINYHVRRYTEITSVSCRLVLRFGNEEIK